MKLIFLFLFFTLDIFASFEEGRKVFEKKCSSCHQEYISMALVKENFFEKGNTLLNLKAPSANMIVWAMLDSSKKIGDENEADFQAIEIENFLRTYLETPDRFNTICDDSAIDYYENKESMKGQITDDEYLALVDYFLTYKDNIEEKEEIKKAKFSKKEELRIIDEAKKSDKKIIVYATASNCYFCKKMDREVFKDSEVKKILGDSYIFLEVDMNEASLPFDLQKEYKRITPSFFVLNSDSSFITQYKGAWIKKDFIQILKEHR